MAADRARESARPDRLFEDPLAGTLAGAEGRRIMAGIEAGLAGAGARPTCERRVIPADLTCPWADDLVSAGFAVRAPAVFIAEGLLGYLEEPEVHRLLATLARLAGPGSVLLTDVAGHSPSGAPYLATWLARLEAAGMSRRFATDDPESLLASHGWEADVAEYGEEGANFGRWPWPPIDRHDTSLPHAYLISARRSGPAAPPAGGLIR